MLLFRRHVAHEICLDAKCVFHPDITEKYYACPHGERKVNADSSGHVWFSVRMIQL